MCNAWCPITNYQVCKEAGKDDQMRKKNQSTNRLRNDNDKRISTQCHYNYSPYVQEGREKHKYNKRRREKYKNDFKR